jgi:hypothetical protein
MRVRRETIHVFFFHPIASREGRKFPRVWLHEILIPDA